MKKQYEDKEFNNALKTINNNLIWKKSQKQNLKNQILTDIDKLEENGIIIYKRCNNKMSFIRRLTYTGVAVIILFCFLIGSAFISPAMAEVVSKIPYLSKIFHSEPMISIVMSELQKKGYKIAGVASISKNIYISVDENDAYIEENRNDIESIATEILKANQYNAYTVKVERQINNEVPEASGRDKALDESLEKINKELTAQQFNILSIGFMYPSPNAKKVNIEIGIDSNESEQRIEQIKEIVAVNLGDVGDYSIKIESRNLAERDKDAVWSQIIAAIYEGLNAKKKYQVTGIAYSFHPEPLEITIKTSINSSDKEVGAKVGNIEETINEFLNTKEMKDKIAGEKYRIIIRSKDKKRIN